MKTVGEILDSHDEPIEASKEILESRGFIAKARKKSAKKRRGLAFTTIWHKPRRKFDLNLTDYVIADMIHSLASNPGSKKPGWCYASREYLGEAVGIRERSVYRVVKKLKEKGLVESDSEGDLRATEKWVSEVYFDKLNMGQ